MVEFGLGHALDEASGEGREHAVGSKEVVGLVGGREEFVEEFRSDVHGVGQGVEKGQSGTTSYTTFLTVPDLLGVNPIEYPKGDVATIKSRLGPACTELRRIINNRGPL
jgi:hypothetical protein